METAYNGAQEIFESGMKCFPVSHDVRHFLEKITLLYLSLFNTKFFSPGNVLQVNEQVCLCKNIEKQKRFHFVYRGRNEAEIRNVYAPTIVFAQTVKKSTAFVGLASAQCRFIFLNK